MSERDGVAGGSGEPDDDPTLTASVPPHGGGPEDGTVPAPDPGGTPDDDATQAVSTAALAAAGFPAVGLDPERRIAAPPGAGAPAAEPGVHPNVPVVYGPRPALEQPSAADGVSRWIEPPPDSDPVPLRSGREALISTARRERRRRRLTLLGYAGAVLLAVSGLWGLGQLAFG